MFCVGNAAWWKKRCLGFIAAALALTVEAAPGHAMQQDDQVPAVSTGTQNISAATQPRQDILAHRDHWHGLCGVLREYLNCDVS